MGFKDKLENLGQKAGSTFAKVQDSTKTFAEKTKIKSKINAENDKIEKIYNSIGKKYFEMFKDNPSEEFANFISEINDANELIKTYNIQLAAFDDTIYCTNCGSQIAKDSEYCSKCGAKQEIPAPAPETVEVVDAPAEENDVTADLEKK